MTTIPLTLFKMTPLSGSNAPQLTPYSARGLTQTLEQIQTGNVLGQQIRRDINGGLMDLTYPQFQKYQSTVTCTDNTAPAFDGAWFGQVVEIECAKEEGYQTGGTPQRPAVSGSSHAESDGFTYYRPVLIMMVVAIHNSFEEWNSAYRWQIDLQEA